MPFKFNPLTGNLDLVNTDTTGVTSVTASSPLQSSGGNTPNISFLNQSANTLLAGPVSGGAAAPTFRLQVLADLPQLTNGQLYIGSTGLSVVAANLTQGANQGVTITNGAGSIQLATVQDIRTSASPTFLALTLSGFTPGSVIFAGSGGLLSQDNSKFFWDDTNFRLGIGTTTPTQSIDTTGNARIRALTVAGFVTTDATGVLSSQSKVVLTTDVSGILPIANGGTNSGTALNNNRIMVSSGGAIVEAAALTNGQLLIGSTGAAPVAANITAGSGITVTNGAGSITIASTTTTPTVVTKSANYTLLTTDNNTRFLLDTSGGAFNLTLLSAATAGSGYGFYMVDSTGSFATNNLTLVPNGTDKISGLNANKIFQTNWGGWYVFTNGTDWFVV